MQRDRKEEFISLIAKHLAVSSDEITTFMLAEAIFENDEKKESYISKLAEAIKKGLRSTDHAIDLGNGYFGAILPGTLESGGESASHRLKKMLYRTGKSSGADIAWAIGVVSACGEEVQDAEHVFRLLEEDLARDHVCQSLIQPAGPAWTREAFTCLLIQDDWAGREPFLTTSKGRFRTVEIAVRDVDYDLPSLLSTGERAVVLIAGVDDTVLSSIIKTLQKKGRLKNIPAVLLEEARRRFRQIPIVLSPEIPTDDLVNLILGLGLAATGSSSGEDTGKYRQILSSISAATHQLNQPLQVIAGRMDILALMIEKEMAESDLREKLLDTVNLAKEQALRAATINGKINRLTKV